MALDKETQDFLTELHSRPGPALDQLTVEEFRASARERHRPTGPLVPISSVMNLDADASVGPLRMRVFRPLERRDLPVTVYFHGGGWTVCDLDTHDETCRRLANASQSLVVAVEYRLAPESPFPAAVDDCFAALRWVSEYAIELGADPSRMAVCGDSAGGTLATVVSLMARDAGGPSIRAQVLIVPVVDAISNRPSYIENAEGYFLTRDAMAWFFRHYFSGSSGPDWRAFPIQRTDLAGLPPALVITAEYDPLRDEGEDFALRLAQAGVPTTLCRYPGTIHQFVVLAARLPQGQRAIAQMGDFLRAQFT